MTIAAAVKTLHTHTFSGSIQVAAMGVLLGVAALQGRMLLPLVMAALAEDTHSVNHLAGHSVDQGGAVDQGAKAAA